MAGRILITGATGRTGRQALAQLLAQGATVRALVRQPEEAGLPPEVEVVRGDLARPETIEECLEGIDAVLLVWLAPVDTAAAVVDRIARRARHVVFLSSPYQHPHPFFQAAQPNPVAALHAEIERLIRASGLMWTFLRPGMIAGNAMWWWGAQIRTGDVVRWPYADASTAPVDERDIAAVAVRALHDRNCAGGEYVLTGPEALSHVQQVAILGDVLGRRLRYEEISPEEWRRGLAASDARGADMLLAAWAAALCAPPLVTSAVAEVTGVPARGFREWAEDNAGSFRCG